MKPVHPTFREALGFWLKLGFISFGGPAGQIAIMQAELVERRRWIGQERFLHALNYCMLLPGPEAQQLATYCGWLLHRTWGGIAAGVLFVLPSAILLWGLSYAYVSYGHLPAVTSVLDGLQPAILAVILVAVLRIGRHALRRPIHGAIAAAAFLLLVGGAVPFPAIVIGTVALGALGGRFLPRVFAARRAHSEASGTSFVLDDAAPGRPSAPGWSRSLRVVALGLALWWTPIVVAGVSLGWTSPLAEAGLFFSKAAMVTFGGAYAVLPYVGQQAVDVYGWLYADQMLDGLAFAETTPGPLIMVLQFVGFMGGWNQPGDFQPLVAATLMAGMTTWVTFAPCFLWIFLGAPFVERLRGHALLDAALASVTAAVVGVILNLALWFGRPVLWPDSAGLNLFAAATGIAAFIALARFRVGTVWVVFASGAWGLIAGHW
jgi:chromate transporter